ncbi:MAG: inositol monophosphatase, partial [Rickettsiales bacterium]|nr:inositol monophosphatase [Rickettsiales bacterium]
MNLNELNDLAIGAAIQAGEFLNKSKLEEKAVYKEEGRDIKLIIDQDTEKLIRSSLQTTDIPILGEEYGGAIAEGKYWVIDPIDGTANYFRGLDECCVSIALMEGNEALIGVIYNFNNNQMYTAVKDHGAFLNNAKISVSDIDSKNKASITTGFPASETIESSMDFLEDLKGWKKVRMFGSAALSCAYVASGKCDYYAEK